MEANKIFFIEDDPAISKAVCAHLAMWGFEVQTPSDFQEVLSELMAFSPHLVLLDISLPYHDGYYWCEELRKVSKVPVIFLSSASDNLNVITAINLGGDDFVAKPFDLSVLTAKIHAVLRRTYSFSKTSGQLRRGEVVLDTGGACLLFQSQKVSLTKNESRILQILLESAGRPVSRGKIMERLWEDESFIDDNTLNVCIARLRKKLEEQGLSDFILTKKNFGYYIL